MEINHLCFGFSYLAAFALELGQWAWPRRGLRIGAVAFAVAGLMAHTIFLAVQQPTPAMPYGSLVLLGWVFANFYLYGSLHKGSRAWAVFFLPMVLFFVWLAWFAFRGENVPGSWFSGRHFWGMFHGSLILAASVGIMLAAVASTMYLIQSNRLRQKKNPLGGLRLLSLESLERVNRRSINVAFPLLTIGLLLGISQIYPSEPGVKPDTVFKTLATWGIWIVAVLLLFARYQASLPGRKLAWLTIAAFAMLLVTLLASHDYVSVPGAVSEVGS